ncbi:dolichol phosphate-mannose biosynthesis regulatory protein [Pseudomyrmex gracilis]|uniref:dolichol phosphate-mannose biosynthesis regulatory protein n=1 Tax=Pseudomyrmex gracilis TaxID=219809 RepID=UPI0009958F25|nr:dolichol phosphate-mannose biosynthesis regulatory protein [Pseudomyrmex gracilis]
MFDSDRQKGKVILILTLILFLYYTIWVIGLPFIDDDRLRSLFYPYNLALIVPASFGLIFIGGLILFTVYHIRPYLSSAKSKKME